MGDWIVRLLLAVVTALLLPIVPAAAAVTPPSAPASVTAVPVSAVPVRTVPVSAVPVRTVPAATSPGPARFADPAPRRDRGLPAALAAVLVAGVASLLVRALLAEPAARRCTPRSRPSSS